MNSRALRGTVIFLATSFAAAAPAAAPPIRVTTAPLTATGTGEKEQAFSLKLTTAALTATGMTGREAPFKPVVIRTDPLTATGNAKPASPDRRQEVKRLLLSAAAVSLVFVASPSRAEDFEFSVPVQLAKLDPAFTQGKVLCDVRGRTGSPESLPSANPRRDRRRRNSLPDRPGRL